MKSNNLNQPIGIIGGMGPQASAELLRVLIGMSIRDFGAKNAEDFPEIILTSIPVKDFISDKKNINEVLRILEKRVKNIDKFNPLCLAIACNTAHLLLEDLQMTTSVSFVSIIDEVTKKVVDSGIKKVGLLASPVTIETGLYQSELRRKNIKTILPSRNGVLIIEGVIRNVLAGKIKRTDRVKLSSIALRLRSRGAEGIILGCTELPLIFPKRFPIPVFDSIEITARKLLEKFYEKRS